MQRLRPAFDSLFSFKTLCWLTLFLFCLFVIDSCRKDNINASFDEAKASAKFFAYPASVDTNIKQIAQEIKRQNEQYHFLQFFIDNNGYPAWDKYQMATSGVGTVAIIPFSFDAQQETNGFMICRKSPDNQFEFELYKKDFLVSYGFVQRENDSLNAMEVQNTLNKFNYDNFNITIYRITDYRMLPDSIIRNHPQEIDPANLTGHIRPQGKQKGETAQLTTTCNTTYTYTDWWWSPSGANDVNEPGSYYAYTTYDATTTCYNYGGGGTSYGGSSTNTQWWNGGGGGGNGSPPPPPPPPVRDSNYFKGLLNKQAVAISKLSDSAFKMAQNKKVEYSLIITQKGENVYARNMKTDNHADSVTMNYRPPTGETLIGEDHTHQDDIPNGPPNKRCSLDMGDVYALWNLGNFSKQDFTSFVEMGDIRQAIVIEDPVKATNFLYMLKKRPYLNDYLTKVVTSPLYFTNFRQVTLNATLYQLSSSSFSGIGFYQTIDAGKVLFTKLN